MSNVYPPTPAPTGSASTASATADEASQQAKKVAGDAATAGENVLGTAQAHASSVAGEAKTQAKDLLAQTQGELRDQAGVQQKRVATGLHSLSDELGSMASSSEGSGVASDLVQQAASRAGSIATWLEDRDPGSLLEEVKDFARRRPGTFIGIAAVAGVVAGRLTRSITSVAADEKEAEAAARPTSTPTSNLTDRTTDVTPSGLVTGSVSTGIASDSGYATADTVPPRTFAAGTVGGPLADELTPPPAVYTDAVDPVEEAGAYGLKDSEPTDNEAYLRNQRS